MTRLYGLERCDTCQKARNWLRRFAVEHEFVDYRAAPIAAEVFTRWAAQLGGFEQLINRASTTWRSLPPARKNPGSTAEWIVLLREYPALVKRPVVLTGDGTVSVGFTDKLFKTRFGVV